MLTTTPAFNTLSTSPSLHTAIIVPSSRFLLSTASLRPRPIASGSKRSSSESNGTDYSRNPGKGSETITSKAHSFHNHPSPVSDILACNSEIVLVIVRHLRVIYWMKKMSEAMEVLVLMK